VGALLLSPIRFWIDSSKEKHMTQKFEDRKAKSRRKAHTFPWYRKMMLALAETAWVLAANCAAGWIASPIL
jgi:hypothetical protein